MKNDKRSNYKWYMLFITVLTLMLVTCFPMAMPVLFPEISKDLGLDLVQIGTVWGITNLGGIFVLLISGALSDRFGLKRTITILCFLTGITGALRGLSGGFASFTLTMFLLGLMNSMATIVVFKVVNLWFPREQLGIANTILTVSVAVGSTLGSMISATVLSPLLHGWKNVVFLYGALSFLVGIPWLLSRKEPAEPELAPDAATTVPIKQALSRVIHNKAIWLLGIISLGHWGCSSGVKGYLMIYLEGLGWTTAAASGTLAALTAFGVIGAASAMVIFRKYGSWKAIIFTTVMMTTTGTVLLALGNGPVIWIGVVIAGLAWEAYMTSNFTLIMETEGLGPAYTGTAIGLWSTIGKLSFFSPIIGNSLADINPSWAFLFWAAVGVVPLLCCIRFVKETGWRAKNNAARSTD